MARVKGEIWEQTQGGSEETEPSSGKTGNERRLRGRLYRAL